MADVAVVEFACPSCPAVFDKRQKLGTHRVIHETVVCETCGKPVNRKGIGSHRLGHRNAAAALLGEVEDPVVVLAPVIIRLRDLTPPLLGAVALERAAELLDKHPDHRGMFIVAGATYGPHLTSRQNVGGIVAKAHEPCLVIDLDLLSPLAEPDMPAAWPHARRG